MTRTVPTHNTVVRSWRHLSERTHRTQIWVPRVVTDNLCCPQLSTTNISEFSVIGIWSVDTRIVQQEDTLANTTLDVHLIDLGTRLQKSIITNADRTTSDILERKDENANVWKRAVHTENVLWRNAMAHTIITKLIQWKSNSTRNSGISLSAYAKIMYKCAQHVGTDN